MSIAAQEVKTYKGKFQNGSGYYSYYEDSEGNRVKHGDFYYEKQGYMGIGSYGQNTLSVVSGKFKNGRNDGVWIERYIEFRAGWTGALSHWDENKRQYVLDGFTVNNNKDVDLETIMKCRFFDGKLDGAYELQTYKTRDGKPVLIESIKAKYGYGVLIGRFSLHNQNNKVNGKFDADGNLDSVWTNIEYKKIRQLTFDHGYMKSMVVRSKGEGILLHRFDNLKVNYFDSLPFWGFTEDTIENQEEDRNKQVIQIASNFKGDHLPIYTKPLEKTEFLNLDGTYNYHLTTASIPYRSFDGYTNDSILINHPMIATWSYNDPTASMKFTMDSIWNEGHPYYLASGKFSYKDKIYKFNKVQIKLDDLYNRSIPFGTYDFVMDNNEAEVEDEEKEERISLKFNVYEKVISAYVLIGKSEKSLFLFRDNTK